MKDKYQENSQDMSAGKVSTIIDLGNRVGFSNAEKDARHKSGAKASLKGCETQKLRQLECENEKLRQIVIDLSLDKRALQDLLLRNW